MAEKVPALVNVAATLTGKAAPSELAVKPIINSKKVSDHHAIIPTLELQKCNFAELPKGEFAILQLIATRLLVSVAPPYRYAETVAEFRCGEEIFTAKGKTVLELAGKPLRSPERLRKQMRPCP